MRLVDGICKIVAQLLDDFLDAIKFFCAGKIPDDTFKAIQPISLEVEEVGERGKDAYSSAPTFLLSYSLSLSARWILGSILVVTFSDGHDLTSNVVYMLFRWWSWFCMVVVLL